jgi:hypothetical protein
MTLQEQIDLLGWKDITTNRQISNGTRIYRLPIKMYGEYIEVGSFETGYVRRMNGGYTPYQLNKRNYYDEYYKDYKTVWNEDRSDYIQKPTGKYNKMTCRGCVKIMSTRKRLQYLIDYCLKNYYIKQANMIEDGKFVPKWKYDMKNRYTWSCGQITDNENGDIYVHEQHAYWNKKNKIGWRYGNEDEISVTINGHRYKVK